MQQRRFRILYLILLIALRLRNFGESKRIQTAKRNNRYEGAKKVGLFVKLWCLRAEKIQITKNKQSELGSRADKARNLDCLTGKMRRSYDETSLTVEHGQLSIYCVPLDE